MVRSVKPDVMAKIRVAQDMQPGCKQAGRQTSSVAVPAQLGDPEWNGPWCMLIRQLLIDRPNPAIPLCNGNVTRCGKVPHLVAADLLLLDLLHGVVVQRCRHQQQVHLCQLPLRPSLRGEHWQTLVTMDNGYHQSNAKSQSDRITLAMLYLDNLKQNISKLGANDL